MYVKNKIFYFGTVDRFRPNIYVAGDFPPFAEDQWAFIKIGSAIFRYGM
jgi:uncharacterized protein YcbX